MQLRTFDTLLSFMLGASWAFIIIGALVTYSTFSFLGWLPALFITFIFLFIAFLIVLLLETLMMFRKNFDEKREQTRLLKEILDTLKAEKSF